MNRYWTLNIDEKLVTWHHHLDDGHYVEIRYRPGELASLIRLFQQFLADIAFEDNQAL